MKTNCGEAEQWEGVKTYSSYDDAVNDPDIDAFLLLLPHDLHAEFSIKALHAGKHVLVEKPMAMNVREAEAMQAAAEQNGVILMIGQSRQIYSRLYRLGI